MTRFAPCIIRGFVTAAALAAFAMPSFAETKAGLNIYNWSEYIGEKTLANFEKETGIKVRYDTYESNEILNTRLKAGKSGYDLVVPSAHWAKPLIKADKFQKLDKSKIPNFKNLDPAIMKQLAVLDPNNEYLIPWLWGTTVVGINVEKVKAALGGNLPENAWDLVFKPEIAAKVATCGLAVQDSADNVVPAALQYLGKDPFSKVPADYQAAAQLLKSIRGSVKAFWFSGMVNDFAAGQYCVVLGWVGDHNLAAARAVATKSGQQIEVLIPKSGAVVLFDTLAIPKDAGNVDAAYKFIDYILRPEVNAELSNKVLSANSVPASLKFVRPEIANNKTLFLPPEDLARMTPANELPSDVRRLRSKVFSEFKDSK